MRARDEIEADPGATIVRYSRGRPITAAEQAWDEGTSVEVVLATALGVAEREAERLRGAVEHTARDRDTETLRADQADRVSPVMRAGWSDLLARAERAEAERDEARAALRVAEAALARVRALHPKRTMHVYSEHHNAAEHVSEDERCTEECFAVWEICDGDGVRWPCLTVAALVPTPEPPEAK